MISLSHAVNGFAILALTCTCDAATLSSSVLYVTRTRNIATHEEYLVRISVSYLTADLTLGTTSHALIESPGGELRSIPLGMERGGDVTFSATFPLSSLDAASGNWSVTVNDGAQAHEDVVLLVPGHSYTLWRSPTLGAWQSVSTFTAPSNVHRHQETMAASGMFFRLEENP